MIRSLDDEVRRLREEAAAETTRAIEDARTTSARLVADARAKADRIVEEANRQVSEAEARRDAMLQERAAIISELSKIRDTIVRLAGRFDQERPDLTASPRRSTGGHLPPPPRRGRIDENQEALFSSDQEPPTDGDEAPAPA